MLATSGTTWETLDVLPPGTVVVVLRIHRPEPGMEWLERPPSTCDPQDMGRVLALGPRGLGLLWSYSLEYMPEHEP